MHADQIVIVASTLVVYACVWIPLVALTSVKILASTASQPYCSSESMSCYSAGVVGDPVARYALTPIDVGYWGRLWVMGDLVDVSVRVATMARRSPYGVSKGSSMVSAPALIARLYAASASAT